MLWFTAGPANNPSDAYYCDEPLDHVVVGHSERKDYPACPP